VLRISLTACSGVRFLAFSVMAVPSGSMRRPAAIDRKRGAGDGCGRVGREEDGYAAELLRGGETLIRLLREQHVADDFLARNAVSLCLACDLRFDQRRVDIARADRIAGDAHLGGLESRDLG